MIREERLESICVYVNENQYVSIKSLVDHMGVSKSTVRRDLIQLNQEGKISFVRGGVESVRKASQESGYQVKEMMNVSEKQRIGAAAAELIQSGDTVFIAAGTTAREILGNLSGIKQLNLITNDIKVAMDMGSSEDVNVIVAGGKLRKGHYTLLGFTVEEQIQCMKLDTAFISCDAMDYESGCYIANGEEVGVVRQVIKSASKVVMLADHSKFSANAFMMICDFSAIDILITGKEAPEKEVSALRSQGVKVILV